MPRRQLKPQEWYDERNEKLLEDYQRGLATKELVKKYDISTTRVYQIINRLEEEEK